MKPSGLLVLPLLAALSAAPCRARAGVLHPEAGGAAAFRPATPRHAALLSAIRDWKTLIPEDPKSALAKKHGPALAEIEEAVSTPEAAKELDPLEERFEAWKAAFMRDMFARTHLKFYSDPKRFERYLQEQIEAVSAIRGLEGRSVDSDKSETFSQLKAELGGAPDWEKLDWVFEKLGRRRETLVIDPKMDPSKSIGSSPKDIVFSPAHLLSPEDLPPPPPLVAGDPGYQRLRAYVVSSGVSEKTVDLVFEEAAAQGADPLMILSVIKTESYFHPGATSPANARGLMQLIDPTARAMGISNPEVNSYNPELNVKAGVKLLGKLWEQFVSGTSFADLRSENVWSRDDIKRVIASYNAGPGNAYRWTHIKETSDYVPRVLKYYSEFRRAASA